MYRHVLWGLTAVSLAYRSPAAAQVNPLAEYQQGAVRFSQGGKDASWALNRGNAQEIPGPRRMRTASLMYTPDGQYPNTSAPSFKLTFGTVDGVPTLAVLAVVKGPAGSGVYRSNLTRCTLQVDKLEASGIDGSGTCTGQFEGGPPVTQFRFSAQPATSRAGRPPAGDVPPVPPPPPPPPPEAGAPAPVVPEATWTFDVQQPEVGWVKAQVHARYRTEVVRHPRRGWYGARSCLGLVDIPVRWDSLGAGTPFCIKLTYIDGDVVRAEGATTVGKTVFQIRPPRPASAAFPDGKISGPLENGGVHIELERHPWMDAVENEEAAGCTVSPDPVLSYADLPRLPSLDRRWTKPSWDGWATTCTGSVSLEIRVRRQ